VDLRAPNGAAGIWLGASYHAPFVRSDAPGVDPRVRLGFDIGGVYSVAASWDFYVDLAIIDRGDASNPVTTLPVLDGGFDQQQIIFGVTRHWPARHRIWW
jgi:hypothetical protein